LIDPQHAFDLECQPCWGRPFPRCAPVVVVHACALARGGCRPKDFF